MSIKTVYNGYTDYLVNTKFLYFKLVCITFHTIRKIESGTTPDLRNKAVKKIVDALGVSIDDLMK